MKSRNVLMLTGLWLAALAALPLVKAQKEQPPAQPVKPADEFTFSGPFTHGNLTVFLVHGKDTIAGKDYLTLQEALEQKKVVVHETDNVNELSVENVSPDADVFLQTGDIVKGGKQDRIIAFDLVVPPKSGKTPIASFCVEQGRWRQRGGEAAARFESSSMQAAGKDLKVAFNFRRDQSEVWKQVAENQRKLSMNVGKPVQSAESSSSLQLSQENKDLLKITDECAKELTPILEGKKDVIGYAYAINGKVESADVYGSAALFRKLWPRLLGATAIEAVAERKKDAKFEPATVAAVKAFLTDAASGKQKDTKDVNKRVRVTLQESEKCLLIEARDQQAAQPLHRCYLAK